MKKIRVLHIIESLNRGGAELRLLEDVRNLTDFNHTVSYLFKNGNEYGDEFRKAGADIYCLSLRNKLDLFLCFLRFLKLIKTCKPNIIHSHLFFANILSRLTAIFYPHIGYMQTIHFPEYIKDGSIAYSRLRYLVEICTLFLRRPKFIAVSEYLKKESLKAFRLNNSEVAVIYNYLNDYWFANEPIQHEHYPKKILAVGRLHKQKGFECLIKAASIVLENGSDAEFCIAGDGPEKGRLSTLIKKLGLEKRVFLLGRKNDILKLISESDIFVFPSLNEGLGIALIEAMSQQKICIAFDVGPLPEIIENNVDGFLIPSRNIQLLAEKIIYVINNYLQCYMEIAKNARLKTKARFSKENSVNSLRKHYYSLLNRN